MSGLIKLTVGIALIALSLHVGAQSQDYKVMGKVSGMESGRIYINYAGPGATDFVKDSIRIENGSFVYAGKMQEPHQVFFNFDTPEEEREKGKFGFKLFLDGTNTKVVVDRYSLDKPIITGNTSQQLYQEILSDTDLFNRMAQIGAKSAKAWKTRDQQQIDATNMERERVMDSLASYLLDIKGADKSSVVAFMVYNNLRAMDSEKLEKVLDRFDSSFRNSLYLADMVTEVEREKNVKLGMLIPRFALADTSGKVWTDNDFRGKYLLIDFGASWCGWCKLEKPFLIGVHTKFREKNFELINISLDRDRPSWVNDLQKEVYPWLSISDLNGAKGELAKNFNIRGVPEIMLIDPNGKIIAKGLRGEQIKKELSKYL